MSRCIRDCFLIFGTINVCENQSLFFVPWHFFQSGDIWLEQQAICQCNAFREFNSMPLHITLERIGLIFEEMRALIVLLQEVLCVELDSSESPVLVREDQADVIYLFVYGGLVSQLLECELSLLEWSS